MASPTTPAARAIEEAAEGLRAKRTELLNQVHAIDAALTALTALATAGITAVTPPELQHESADDVTSPVVPTRIKARRVLSDDHRQTLLDGRRLARHKQAVDKGHARELLAPSPASPQPAGPPRLVKASSHQDAKHAKKIR